MPYLYLPDLNQRLQFVSQSVQKIGKGEYGGSGARYNKRPKAKRPDFH
jgi:hypothetical protein